MKILIWIHKDDIESNNITKYWNVCPASSRWMDYYQIEITQDEFVQLQDTTSGGHTKVII
jgi:hypothetical protein